jgi:hypothetical protein
VVRIRRHIGVAQEDLERVFSLHRVGECLGQWVAVYQVDGEQSKPGANATLPPSTFSCQY